ncbi:MAG: TerB family tellurite resistance protein [Acidobacteria bacterium]|nr:TerB family tellurite resistance protein [Acidobacteriota bacterium]
MKASFMDRGKYYRGLLVLIGRDRVVDPREHALVLQFGKILDFDERFCEAAIADLLDNEHINEEPILFDQSEIAECFLRDAFRLALADNRIHSNELSWLKTVARSNKLTEAWLEAEYRRLGGEKNAETSPESFEIHRYL